MSEPPFRQLIIDKRTSNHLRNNDQPCTSAWKYIRSTKSPAISSLHHRAHAYKMNACFNCKTSLRAGRRGKVEQGRSVTSTKVGLNVCSDITECMPYEFGLFIYLISFLCPDYGHRNIKWFLMGSCTNCHIFRI